MSTLLRNAATKQDLESLEARIVNEIHTILDQPEKPTPQVVSELAEFSGTLGSAPNTGFLVCQHCGAKNFFHGSTVVRCVECNRELGSVDITTSWTDLRLPRANLIFPELGLCRVGLTPKGFPF